jgi:glycosyltransferase involved in cell wall biosynthesis
MNIIQLTPGAGKMFCGNCLRDNALVAGLRAGGHEALMVPLYLPLTLDEPDQSAATPIFFSGISVYLEQKLPFFRRAPRWLHELLASRSLLNWAAGRAAKTRASDLGELTLSMLRGEEGKQARELDSLVNWLQTQLRPEVVCLSNALLVGMARRLKRDLGAPVLCMLQGEDSFLNALPDSHRELCWRTLAEQARNVDRFVAPSQYFAELMRDRLGLAPERVEVIYNGISLEGYSDNGGLEVPGASSNTNDPLVLGYFARMCREKGLPLLVEAYLKIRQRGRVQRLKFRIGGSCGPSDEPLVTQLRRQLSEAGFIGDVEFRPNLERAEKVEFLKELSVFSVPAGYGEAFGLYLIEAMAAGVPVVQPRTAAFTELVDATGGGILCAADNAEALADAIEQLLLNPARAQALGEAGRRAVFERFSADSMTQRMLSCFEALSRQSVQAF